MEWHGMFFKIEVDIYDILSTSKLKDIAKMIGNRLCSHIMTVGGRKGTRCNRKCTRSGDNTRCRNHQTVTCPDCQKTFGNPGSLRRHATKVHNKPYKCKYCNAEFKQHVMYRDHIKKHEHLRLREVEPGRFVEVIEVI